MNRPYIVDLLHSNSQLEKTHVHGDKMRVSSGSSRLSAGWVAVLRPNTHTLDEECGAAPSSALNRMHNAPKNMT